MDKKEIGYCEDCKWWDFMFERVADDKTENYGLCEHVANDYIFSCSEGCGVSGCNDTFGCIHWEGKDD